MQAQDEQFAAGIRFAGGHGKGKKRELRGDSL